MCKSRHPGNAGGNFFISDYGIKVCAAKDTVIVWQPTEWHGTSLAHCNPLADNPRFYQCGLAVVTPQSLTSIWKKVLQGVDSVEKAELALVKEGEKSNEL